jgi:hypothetical protein
LLPSLLCAGVLISAPLAANDELEVWQERILRALERSGEQEPRRDDGAAREGRQSLVAPERADAGARAAAAEARRRYGGRPLAVVRGRDGYRVRLLRDDGRVTTVTIGD